MARAAPEPPQGGTRRYLLDGESMIIAVHQHWAKVAEPVLTAVAGLVVVLWIGAITPASLGLVSDLLWWAWFAVLARMAWKLLEWRHDWFVATDKRLLLTYGLITRKVAMMPLTKVTDMSYTRSPAGQLLGYGRFIMESAGQDQALRSVNWVPDPDHTYRAICAEIFGVQDHDRVLPHADEPPEDHDDGGVGPDGPDDPDGPGWAVSYEDAEPYNPVKQDSTAVPVSGIRMRPGSAGDQQSRAIPTGKATDEGRSVYRSPDLVKESDVEDSDVDEPGTGEHEGREQPPWPWEQQRPPGPDDTGPIPPFRPDPTL